MKKPNRGSISARPLDHKSANNPIHVRKGRRSGHTLKVRVGMFEAGCTADASNTSGAAVSNYHMALIADHRHLALALREPQHFFQSFRKGLNVNIIMLRIGLPGLLGVRSSCFPVNRDIRFHKTPLIVLGP